MRTFDDLLLEIRSCSDDQKQKIFSEIRSSILIHELERSFNAKAEVILEAISRATDLTQRGVRGLLAETAFALDVAPTATGWSSEAILGNPAYDAYLCRNNSSVRIQVKMQRRSKGAPMVMNGHYVVEVQKTRKGEKGGASTRPYRFGEFDILAVCMCASTGRWEDFMYMDARDLAPDPLDKTVIKTMQQIPKDLGTNHSKWTADLNIALELFAHRNCA